MRKIFPLILTLALLFVWSTAWAVDGRTETNIPGPLKQSIEKDKLDIVRSLTREIKEKPFQADQSATGSKRSVDNYINFLPREEPLILTDYLSDDFDDGNFDGWTPVSNGDGDGDEDWAVYTDPYSYAWGTVENHGSGFLVGSDSDAGGALADEEISIDFDTPVGGQLTLNYWLYFRAFVASAEYFEVLIDGVQVELVEAANDVPLVGPRSVIIDDYADGNTHTLTFHYYADYGYFCAFDDVVITDDPCDIVCVGTPEGEPDCYDEYVDEYNTGCNAEDPVEPIWTEISCGDVICGKSGVFQVDDATHRDTDWYTFDLAVPSDVIVTMTGEFPVQLLFFPVANSCDDYSYEAKTGSRCQTITYTNRLFAGTYWLWCGPSDWFTDMVCDGSGGLGIEYELTLECIPTPPCDADIVIGDVNSNLPYSDIGQTNCGLVNDWDETCLGNYDGGEDIIYEFTVTNTIALNINLDPHSTRWTGLLIDDFCPPNEADCVASIFNQNPTPYGFENLLLLPGTYWMMIDTWPDPTPTCIPVYDLTIEEGQLLVAEAQTENIPDCAVSCYGPLGDPDYQPDGNYSWNGNDPANYGASFVMGDAPDRTFCHYNTTGDTPTDCYQYEIVQGLTLPDLYHPTSEYSDGGVMGGVNILYRGFGFHPPDETPFHNIFIHTFTITNNSGARIENYYAGVYFDWDVVYPDPDTVVFDRSRNLVYQGAGDMSYIMGLCLINDDEVNLRSMTGVSQEDYIYPTGPSGGGWLMEDLYNLMSHDGDQIADNWYDDMSSVLSTGPHIINEGESVTIEIAVIGAGNKNDMLSRAGIIGQLDIVDGEIVGPTGSCCDDNTGDCQDDVFILDCAGTRFAANTLCADLDPLCGEIVSCEYVPGDPDCNGTPLELNDVVTMISQYRGASNVCYTCECPPHGDNFAPASDPDGSCVSLELNDVVTEICAYRGTCNASGCADCPPPGRIVPGGNGTSVVPLLKSKVKINQRSGSE